MQEVKNFLIENLSLIDDERLNEKELTELLDIYEDWFQIHNTPLENKLFFKQKYSNYSLAIDCLILWNLALTFIMLRETYEIQFGKELTQKEYFFHLQINLTNNLFSIKYLYELGLDTQAKTIYRNSIEISDLALCILFRKDFFYNHINPVKNKHGNPFVSPKNKTIASIAEKVIDEIYKSLDRNVKTKNLLDRYWKIVRDQHYEILSEIAHGNFHQNIMNSFKPIEQDREIPSIGGGQWLDMEKSLSEICLHQIALKKYFTWALKIKYNIDLFDNTNINHKFIWYLDVVIFEKLMFSIAKPFLKKG